MSTMKKTLLLISAFLITGALGFGFGKYSAPTKVVEVEKIKTVTVEKVVEKKAEKKNVKTVVVQAPDGTTTTTTTDTSTVDTNTNTDTNTVATDEKKKTTTYSRPNWRLAALGGFDPNGNIGKPIYGGSIERRILGPIFVGAFGMSNKSFGVSLSFEF